MTLNQLITATMVSVVLFASGSPAAWADRDRGGDTHRYEDHNRNKKGYVYDRRYHHNRYYPPPGYKLNTLPHHHHVVPYRGTKYYFDAGVWYRPSGSRFVVVIPPVGLLVHTLPPFYTTIWVGGIPYYYSAGVYYTWHPAQQGYIVSEAPPDNDVSEVSPEGDRLFIYPRQGQSEQQQASDRYECHSWSSEQSGFDPTKPGGNVAESQYTSKRDDYHRAMKACLEARGYSVQ